MYGMIHQAARSMALEALGDRQWRAILDRCGLDEEHFISGRHYDDATTFALVGAISSTSGIPVNDLLEQFGRYWISFASASSYARMLDMAGDSFLEMLESLDRMHASIKATMPEASLPSFEVLSSNDAGLDVRYWSERGAGLTPFVTGLLRGLMDRFGEVGAISAKETPDGVVFSIALETRAAA